MFAYMTSAEAATERLRALGPIFRAADARAAGVSWRDLYELRDNGHLLSLSRGLFQLAETAGHEHLDFAVVGARAPAGMICLDSALAYWDLIDEIPTAVHLAVPTGAHRPVIDYPPTVVHVFAASTFTLGRSHMPLERGSSGFWITDRERTVVDAFRLRHRLGDALAHEALRRYLRHKPRPAVLSEVARHLRVKRSVVEAVRILTG